MTIQPSVWARKAPVTLTKSPTRPRHLYLRHLCPRQFYILTTLALGLALPGCSKTETTASTPTTPAATVGAASTASAPVKAAAKATPVRVETVQSTPWVLRFAVTGSVEATRIAQLSSMAEGPVLSVRVREGDPVKRGQVLLTLGRTQAVSSLAESLREDLRREEDNLARTRRLVDIGALPGEQVDTVAANVTRIRSQLARTQESQSDYVISAPWPGVVSKMIVQEGDVATPRAPLVEIIDPGSLVVRVAVAEAEAAHLRLDVQADVTLDAYPQQTFPARVTRLYPTLDVRTHTRTAELELTKPPLLLTGMFARVSLVRETVPAAITVPSYSLLAAPGGGMAVFVVQDGKALRRKVKIGLEMEGRTLITDGLKPGEMLIVAGQAALKDGAAVQVATAKSQP
ncbi:MAG: efflux RND transporter periplasmic adaptor subunit [Gammaproteobacteria bacterium]|nr:efflux RND transporter periplasmic adaptor subunit [Gammaproteobacteria bacterium]MBU4171828.1 efflux RND transporter periplasmic adaptor subunit [Gammaproteobacteria bacterium]